MVNKLIKLIFIISILSTASYGRYKKHVTTQLEGQKYYLTHCSSCHGSGNRGGNLYSIEEWQEIFANNAKELIELHDGEDNVQDVIKYIKSDDFKKQSAKMLSFIQEFAYDSDTIPTCN